MLTLLVIAAIVCAVWRMNLVLNHPEMESRLREYEDRAKQGRREALKKAAPIVSAGAKFLANKLMKK